MSDVTLRRLRCEKCDIKIPKNQPKLRCTVCNNLKHLSCEKLTKADAEYIIHCKVAWTCYECILTILPVNACEVPKNRKENPTKNNFKIKCSVCNGFCYTPRNVRICDFCENNVHVKCWNQSLGCTTCCEDIIPGFRAFSYELLGVPDFKNNKMYNPYSSSHFTQLIGDIFDRENENNDMFNELSEHLINCKYKQARMTCVASDHELSIFSLNIQTLLSKIDKLREDIALYEKFDVLLFNETNCKAENLPNGKDDIKLDGFYDPIIQDPIRSSGRGGGLIIYVNKRVCEEENIKSITPYSEPDNNSGEFQFIKLLDCKGSCKTVILGNVYHTPSCQPDKFNTFLTQFCKNLTTIDTQIS